LVDATIQALIDLEDKQLFKLTSPRYNIFYVCNKNFLTHANIACLASVLSRK